MISSFLMLYQTYLIFNIFWTLNFFQTNLYTEDWIGLKTLDEAGKVKFINVSGGHLEISLSDIKTYILPYLEEEEQEASTKLATMKNSFIRPSSILNFIQQLTGLTGEQRVLQLHTLNWRFFFPTLTRILIAKSNLNPIFIITVFRLCLWIIVS